MKNKEIKWAFFGTSDFADIILEKLKNDIRPDLIITTPDRPKGRKMVLTPSAVKVWSTANKVPILQPEILKDEKFLKDLGSDWDLFIVAAYGKIIPKIILDIPHQGAFNIHPSLLPKYRGPSPLQYQILNNEKELGTTIIKMDEEIDHGPITEQEKLENLEMPVSFKKLEKLAAEKSAKILQRFLAEFLHSSLDQEPELKEQDHNEATFTKMIEKEDGLINLEEDPYKNYLKYLAYEEWPETYFFQKKDRKSVRLKIKEADYQDNHFIIKRVVPEGKKEMSYEDFLKGF